MPWTPPPRPTTSSSIARCARARSPTTSASPSHKENLRVFVEAARKRGEPLDHILLSGPPGLGKTTLAHILAHEMGVQLVATSGPVIEHKGALAALLTTKLQPHDILFIDEIHRLNPVVEESLYPAIDELVMDIQTGEGAYANALRIPVPAVHAHRRHHPHGPAHRAAALALRPRHPSRFLPARRSRPHRGAQREAARRPGRRGRRSRDRPPRPGHPAHRQPPAAPRARLRRGPRHGARRPDAREAGLRAARGRRGGARRHGPALPVGHHRALRRGSGRGGGPRGRPGRAPRHPRRRGRALPRPAGLRRPDAARPRGQPQGVRGAGQKGPRPARPARKATCFRAKLCPWQVDPSSWSTTTPSAGTS